MNKQTNYAPSEWDVKPDGSGIVAEHRATGEKFIGTMDGFNALVAGRKGRDDAIDLIINNPLAVPVTAKVTSSGGVEFDALTSDGIRATMIDRRGAGKPIYRPNGSTGLTFSSGANAPAAIQIIDGVAWITTPVGNHVEVTLPTMSARLAPQSLCIDAEADDWSACASVSYYLATIGYAAFWLRTFNPTASDKSGASEVSGPGRRRMYSDRRAFVPTNSPNFASTQITTHKIRVTPKAGVSVRFCIRGLDWDLIDIPSISNIYDDGYKSVYQHALPLHNELGLVASIGVVAGAVDANSVNTMTWDQLAEWRRYGHRLLPHGPVDYVGNWADGGTYASVRAEVEHAINALVSRGLGDGLSEYVGVTPQGVYWLGSDRQETEFRRARRDAGLIGCRGTSVPQFFNSRLVGLDEMRRYDVPIMGFVKSGDEAADVTALIALVDELGNSGQTPGAAKSGTIMWHYIDAALPSGISPAGLRQVLEAVAVHVRAGRLIDVPFAEQIAWGGLYRKAPRPFL